MRLGLIRLEIGASDTGLYCTTFLTEGAAYLKDVDAEFRQLLDDVVAATAKALSDAELTSGSKAMAWGPGAETLAATLKDEGRDVELVDKPVAPSDNGRSDLPIH